MENLFRFAVLREPNKSSDETNPIDLAADTAFQTAAAGFSGYSASPTSLLTRRRGGASWLTLWFSESQTIK